MSLGRLPLTLVVVVGLAWVSLASADSGSGSGSSVPVATGSGSAAPAPDALPDDATAVQTIAKAVSSKDWFLLAGAALALVIHLARYLLKKKWPTWDQSHYGVFLAAGIAGIAALAIAWLTPGADMASSHTLVGALKLLAAATVTYVLPKKVAEGMAATGTASSSDVK